MKTTGIAGKGSGKSGSQVYVVSHGQQIVRKYQSRVSQPNTQSQVNVRSRFALLSQLSAAMASVIAIPRKANVSPRNAFSRINSQYIYMADGIATADLHKIQLTAGNVAMPKPFAYRATHGIAVQLLDRPTPDISAVVYNIYEKTLDGKISLVASLVVNNAGVDRRFHAQTEIKGGEFIIYAYGLKFRTDKAASAFSSYSIETGEDIARLTAVRKLSTNDYTFTATQGVTLGRNRSMSHDSTDGYCAVSMSIVGHGSVNWVGNGLEYLTVRAGDTLTFNALPDDGYYFLGWKDQGSGQYISTNPQYTQVIEGEEFFTADFN